MKRIEYVIVLALVLLSACHVDDKRTPSASISRDKFEQILLEMHYAEGVHQPMSARKDSVWCATWSDYSAIFNKYHVTAKEFSDTYSYYCYHAKEMDDIYQHLINDVSIEEAQLEKKHK